MTLSRRYAVLARKLFALRAKLALLLLPASILALFTTTPFRIVDGWIYTAFCTLVVCWGIVVRIRATAVVLYRARLQAAEPAPDTASSSGRMPFPTEGIYARIRYPFYAGNFLIWSGIVLYTGTDWFIVGATALYTVCYLIILGREEELMLQKYGEPFRERCERVPALCPGRRRDGSHAPGTAVPAALRRELRNLSGALLALLTLGIVKFRVINLSWGIPSYWLIATAVALGLFLPAWLLRRRRRRNAVY